MSVPTGSNSSSSIIDCMFPPINYAAVEDDLYRSGLPTELNYAFVKNMNVKVFYDAVSVIAFVCFSSDCALCAAPNDHPIDLPDPFTRSSKRRLVRKYYIMSTSIF